MKTSKEINEIAKIHGLTPNTKKEFNFGDGIKFNINDEYFEFMKVEKATLKEGKSGNTTLELFGTVKDIKFGHGEFKRKIGYWELPENELPNLFNALKK